MAITQKTKNRKLNPWKAASVELQTTIAARKPSRNRPKLETVQQGRGVFSNEQVSSRRAPRFNLKFE
jgi:hypothetical protein